MATPLLFFTIRAGYAWWYRKYVPHDKELERLEKEAREAKRGLWSDPHAIAPWECRKLQRSPTESQIQFSIEVTANVDPPFEVSCRYSRRKIVNILVAQYSLAFSSLSF
jgi:hypothetical protein